jgi:hypothetical protein
MLADIIDEVGNCWEDVTVTGGQVRHPTSKTTNLIVLKDKTSNKNDFGTKRYLIFGAKKHPLQFAVDS